MKTEQIVKKQYNEHIEVAQTNKENLTAQITKAADMVIGAFKNGKKLYACGNGGSACDAMHMVEEFVGRYKHNRPAMPAHNLMDPSIVTCCGNDFGYDEIFKRQIEAYGQEGDVFVGISTSGNSANVINALEEAKKKNMKTISFLGKSGGKMKGVADLDIIVNSNTTARIQEMHILAIHSILECADSIIYNV